MSAKDYAVERRAQAFERMVKTIAPYIGRCIFSFVETYKKLEANMPELMPPAGRDMKRPALRYALVGRLPYGGASQGRFCVHCF